MLGVSQRHPQQTEHYTRVISFLPQYLTRFYHAHFTDGDTESLSEDLLRHSFLRNRPLSLGPLEQKAEVRRREVKGRLEKHPRINLCLQGCQQLGPSSEQGGFCDVMYSDFQFLPVSGVLWLIKHL